MTVMRHGESCDSAILQKPASQNIKADAISESCYVLMEIVSAIDFFDFVT